MAERSEDNEDQEKVEEEGKEVERQKEVDYDNNDICRQNRCGRL